MMASLRNRRAWLLSVCFAVVASLLAGHPLGVAGASAGAGLIPISNSTQPQAAVQKAAPVIKLKAIAIQANQVDLAWRLPANLPAPAAIAVYRDGQLLVTLPGSATEYVDASVAAGSRYRYMVTATDALGNELSASKAEKVVTPVIPFLRDDERPVPVDGLTATAYPGYILLDWYASNDNTDITAYLVRRNGKRLVLLDSGTLSYQDTAVQSGATYVYSIEAIDTGGNRSLPETVTGTAAGTAIAANEMLPPAVYLPIVSNSSEEPIKDESTPEPLTAEVVTSQLRRYPYLTDLVGPYATINWATNNSNASGFATYGQVGSESCTAHSVAATKSTISVNSVTVYQWKAMLTLSPDTMYCYRVFLGSTAPVDLLGSDPSPQFMTQLPAGSTKPFSFIVVGDWGDIDNGGAYQSALMGYIAQSGARFAVTTGDNAYSSGSQTNFGDLVETGAGVSGVFGPQGWGVPGRSMAIFPALGNHGMSNADSAGNSQLVNFPQAKAAQLSNGRYASEFYGGIDGTTGRNYPSAWYAFDAGIARIYILKAAWADTNIGTASDPYQVDYDYHWTPASAEYQWLVNDLATHPSALKFAVFHYPLYSDNKSELADTYLRGAGSLEGLLRQNGVNLIFNGHAHLYQRSVVNGQTTYLVGATGVKLQRMDAGCSSTNVYAVGWSYTNNRGYACGAAPVPATMNQIYSFVKVSVNGGYVTVSPMNAAGQVFDEQVYQFGSVIPTSTPTPTATNTSMPTSTSTNTPMPTDTPTPTATNTSTPTSTSTNTPAPTSTPTPTPTATNAEQAVPTATETPLPTATEIAVATPTMTDTPLSTSTSTATPTDTPTPTPTATNTSTPTSTSTLTNTPTPTSTPTPTATNTSTPTSTSTSTSTNTPTPTSTPTPTATNTSTPTNTPTPTSTPAGPVTLVAQGSTWRYLDNNSNQGTTWISPTFVDTAWVQGPAPLGYGDPMSTTVNGGPTSNRYITTYFRKTFTISNPGAYRTLTLLLRRDDGAVIYLNGVEVVRSNMPTGPITYQTLAASTIDGALETTFYSYTVPASALVAGNNTLAVEIHQRANTSSDIGFDLRLDAAP